jgi:hypothetical protein
MTIPEENQKKVKITKQQIQKLTGGDKMYFSYEKGEYVFEKLSSIIPLAQSSSS